MLRQLLIVNSYNSSFVWNHARLAMAIVFLPLLLNLGSIPAAAFSFQGARGEKSKPSPAPKPTPTPKTTPNSGEGSRRNTPPATRPTPTPRTAPAGEVTVRTLPGCSVSLDARARGVTGQDGMLSLPKLTPGEHILTISKAGYEKQELRILAPPNQSQVIDVTLTPLPVSVAIYANVSGAEIEVNGQRYTDSITNLQLPPGTYQIKVSKSGYRTLIKELELRPAKSEELNIALEKISVEELLAQAENDFRAQRYDRVIAACLDILSVQPDQPRTHQMIGLSYFNTERYSESVQHLVKAIQLGEQITLPAKHHHVEGRTILGQANDGLCSGQLVLRKSAFEFQSSDPGHSFNIPPSKFYELSLGSHKNTPRMHTRVGILNGKKEEKKDFNFFADRVSLRKRDPNNSLTDVVCQGCQPATDAIYQVLLQIKK